MGDSPDPPPPPPDYVNEKAAFSQSEYAKRKAEADAYNALVQKFNTSLSGYGSNAASLNTAISGLGLKDDEKFGDYTNQINNLQNSLYALNFSGAKPNWESTVMSPYGAVSVDMPSLLTPDYEQRNTYIGQLGGASSALSSLQQRRKAEESRINQFDSQMYGNLGSLNSRVNSANYGDLSALNALQAEYDSLGAQRSGFTSEILGDYTSSIAPGLSPLMTGVDTRLKSLFQDRANEIQRIKNYENDILAKAGGFSNSLSGLNIANEAGMKSLRDQINAYQSEVNRFSTPIMGQQYFDLSQELGDVQSVEDKLNQMFSERETELGKVKAFEDQMNNTALGLASNARTADIYNRGRLDDMLAQIALAKQKSAGFSSLLPTNVITANGQLDSAEQLVNQLLQQRETALSQFDNRFDATTGAYGNLNPYDETGMQNALNQLYGFQNQLSPFMGSDVTGYRQDVQTKLMDIQDKLSALTAKRAEFEQQAQMMLNSINGAGYTGMDQVTGALGQANDLDSQVKLYKATQAMDEIQQIMDKLNAEKSRLTRDAANVSARTAVESANPLGTSNINDLMNRITPEQYAQLVSLSKKVQTGETTVDEYNAFLKSLGIGA